MKTLSKSPLKKPISRLKPSTKKEESVKKPSTEPTEKVQKLLADLGSGSRRQMEKAIAEGRVSVNGQIIKLGDRAKRTDRLRLDGHIVNLRHKQNTDLKVLLYYKPEGEICTRSDPEGRPTVFSSIPHLRAGRWVQVGRLDVNTSGLLLFTNDGDLANKLMHPKYEVEREYAVRVLGKVTPEMLQQLRTGVMLEDGMAHFEEVKEAGGEGVNRWYHVMLKEGRQREVRRLFEALGAKVNRLIRIRYGCLVLPPRLKRGQWEYLEDADLQALQELVKVS